MLQQNPGDGQAADFGVSWIRVTFIVIYIGVSQPVCHGQHL
jgi:hypothetical protein